MQNLTSPQIRRSPPPSLKESLPNLFQVPPIQNVTRGQTKTIPSQQIQDSSSQPFEVPANSSSSLSKKSSLPQISAPTGVFIMICLLLLACFCIFRSKKKNIVMMRKNMNGDTAKQQAIRKYDYGRKVRENMKVFMGTVQAETEQDDGDDEQWARVNSREQEVQNESTKQRNSEDPKQQNQNQQNSDQNNQSNQGKKMQTFSQIMSQQINKGIFNQNNQQNQQFSSNQSLNQ